MKPRGHVAPVFGVRTAALASLLVFAALAASCGGPGTLTEPAHPALPHKQAKSGRPPVNNQGFPGARLAVVPEGTFGPYLGTRAEGIVAAWAAEFSGKRHWLTSAIGERGETASEPKTIADAPPEVDLVAVRPLGGGTRGFVLLSSSREFSGERVDVMALGTHGELIGPSVPLAQSLPAVVWVDAVPTATGAVAMWAVRRDDRADLVAVEVGSSGGVKEQPATVVSGVRAWQVVATAEGVAIAAVMAGKNRGEPGPLKLYYLDGRGQLERRSLIVNEGTTTEPDVDLARIGDRLVLAWSDRRDVEPHLYCAVVDAAGALVKPPAPLGRPFGPQTVLRIVPPDGGGQAFLAWENAIERPAGGRAVRVATLGADGVLGETSAVLRMGSPDAAPELAPTAKGIAALTLAPACRRGDSCANARTVPTFVKLDAALDVVASEPLRVAAEHGATADLSWGLACRGVDCTALAVTSATPSPVYVVGLGGLSNDWTPAARRVSDAPPPRVSRVDALAKSESVAEITATRVAGGSLLAWLTYFDPSTPFTRSKTPAPDGKYEPPRAVLRVRRLPEKGPTPEPVVLSYRADSPGGVALAPGDPARGTSLLAWVGIDNKVAQAFVTLIGPDGKKIAQKMLTHAKLGVSDVAVAQTPDGWVVAFVDEGENVSEVHVTKIDAMFRAIVPEKRIGSAATTSTSVQLLTRGEHVFAIWSEARGPSAGVADVFAARLALKDLSEVGPEHPLAQTAANSRSPALAPFGDGAVVAWVEDSSRTGEQAAASLMLARLDSGAEAAPGAIATVSLDGSVDSVGLTCSEAVCHVAASVSAGGGGNIQAFEWRGGGDIRATTLVSVNGTSHGAVAPVVLDGEVFYADSSGKSGASGASSDIAIRRMNIDWQ